MANASPQAQTRDDEASVLRQLPSLLMRAGYIDAYCVFGMLHLRFREVRAQLDALPPPVRTLASLFMLGDPVEPSQLRSVLADEQIDALLRLGVLLPSDGGYSTAGLVLLPLLGQMLFIPKPSVDPQAYFGDDSAVLACRLLPPRDAHCLDLCAGPGTQALRCCALARSALAIEINPIAVACAELNFVLNGVDDRAEVRRGDLYTVLREGEQFDYVVGNPPVLPFSPSLPFPAVAAGGDDGLQILRRVLDGLPSVLRRDGWAQLLACSLGDENGPHLRGELETYARAQGFHIVMTAPARVRLRPGDRFFEVLAQGSARPGGLDVEVVRQKLMEHFAAANAEFLYPLFLTLSRGGRAEVVMTEHFREQGGFWFK